MLKIRFGTGNDASMISELGVRAFRDTFSKDNSAEDMNLYITSSFSPQIQFDELSNPNMIFLIAELDDSPVGFAHLELDSTEKMIRGLKPLELKRIYTLQEFIGKGVGKELMQASLAEARKRDCDCVWLGVWERNLRAIAFYQKWGFTEVGTHIFTVGNDPQQDFIMELDLSE